MAYDNDDLDLILIIGYFRSAMPLLSVIRYLSSSLRIGLRFQPLNPELKNKVSHLQKEFELLCVELGASLLSPRLLYKCELLIVQQFPYDLHFVSSIKSNISARVVWGALSLASMGLEAHDLFINQFGVSKVTVPDKGLANFLLSSRSAHSHYQGLEMVEVGLPFRDYPLFDDFSVDWIFASPTLYSFRTEAEKHCFLRDVLKLLQQLPSTDTVAYKPHNGNERDYFSPLIYSLLARILIFVPRSICLLETLIDKFPDFLPSHTSRLMTAFLHLRLMDLTIPMSNLNLNGHMSLESFLPGVRKGVIGGESNTMWGVTHFDLTYCNCVSRIVQNPKSQLLSNDGSSTLGLNLVYFGIPYYFSGVKSETTLVTKNASIQFNIVDLLKHHFSIPITSSN
jgi:hypothetical protein